MTVRKKVAKKVVKQRALIAKLKERQAQPAPMSPAEELRLLAGQVESGNIPCEAVVVLVLTAGFTPGVYRSDHLPEPMAYLAMQQVNARWLLRG